MVGVEGMKVGELLNSIHNHYIDRLTKLQIENIELKMYKALAENEFEQDVIVENLQLKKQVEYLTLELESYRKHGAPF